VNIRGVSAHADCAMLTEWVKGAGPPGTAFVVHGEPASAATLAEALRSGLDWNSVVPRYQERVRIA